MLLLSMYPCSPPKEGEVFTSFSTAIHCLASLSSPMNTKMILSIGAIINFRNFDKISANVSVKFQSPLKEHGSHFLRLVSL